MRGPVRKEGPWCGGCSDHCDNRAVTRILIVERSGDGQVQTLRDWPLCEFCMIAMAHVERGLTRMIFEVPMDWSEEPVSLMATYDVTSS